MKKIKKTSSKKIFKSKWFDIFHDKIILPDKKKGDYYYIYTLGSVMIIPITQDNKIILTKQYRYLTGKNSIEIPGGGMKTRNSKNEAKKELEEETGYKAKNWKKVGEFYPFNGIASEKCHAYIAKDLIKTKQNLDDTEFIEVLKKPIKQVYEMIEKNEIKDGMTLAALNMARKYLIK